MGWFIRTTLGRTVLGGAVLILYAIGELTGLWKGMGRLFG
jgi:hypothetical protein